MISEVKFLTSSVGGLPQMEQSINDLIQQGWQPVGELKVVKDDKQDVLLQELILWT